MKNSKIVIFITAKTSKEAGKIAQYLLNNSLAGCCNIISGIKSYFFWDGKLAKTRESLLLVKSDASLLGKVIKLVKKYHSYKVPEIIALPILAGDRQYLNWLTNNMRKLEKGKLCEKKF